MQERKSVRLLVSEEEPTTLVRLRALIDTGCKSAVGELHPAGRTMLLGEMSPTEELEGGYRDFLCVVFKL